MGLLRSTDRAELRAIAQPPEHSPAVTDQLYRRASIYLSVPLAHLGATPNGITVAWIVLGLAGAAMLVTGAWSARVTGALLFQLAYLLDYVDGEVARLTARRSRSGELLDLLGHGLHKVSLPLAVAWTASGGGAVPALLALGAAGAAAIVVGDAVRFYAACVGQDLASGDLGHTARPPRRGPLTVGRVLRALFGLSFESPGLYAVVLVAAVADLWTPLTLYWAAGGLVWLVWRVSVYAARLDARAGPAAG